ncbi:MAG TPA: prephenate dehydrogenase [bacterium]|nr:prephenate dehydrogenase [bacterium]
MNDFKKIGIVGLGLIGGSIGKTIKKKSSKITVYGISRRQATLIKAKEENIIDEYFLNFDEIVENSELLVLCTPIDKIEYYFRKIKQTGKNIYLTDVASVKKRIVEKGEKILGPLFPYVGSHPMAGSEETGLFASSDNLFEGKNVIITPTKSSDKNVVKKIENFWQFLGANTFFLTPSEHDKFVSLTSHLPHFLVFQFLKIISQEKEKKKIEKCIGPGFLDSTRIGKSNVEMWTEIFLNNKENILRGISKLQKEIEKTKKYLKANNKEKILKEFEKGNKWRNSIEKK